MRFVRKFFRSSAFSFVSLTPLFHGDLALEPASSSLDKKIPLIKQLACLNRLREAAENSSLPESLAAYFSEPLTPDRV